MSVRAISIVLVSCTLLSATLGAQTRDEGWEAGAQLLYQGAQDIEFTGGSSASLEDDFGLAVTFAYRFNYRLEVEFGLDWNTVDYDVNVASASAPGLGFSARGDLESFTPRVNAYFNFLEGSLTPYLTAGVGWSFIDTNIPDAAPQIACWWDPWFGEMCGSFQSTRTTDEFTYQLGGGLRWDLSPGYTMRLGYEKHWIDFSEATSAADFDQFKLGITLRY